MSSTKVFSSRDALEFGWQQTKTNWQVVLACLGIGFLIFIVSVIFDQNDLVKFLVSLIQMAFTLALLKISLMVVNGQPIQIKDIFWFKGKIYLNSFVAGFLYFLLIILGLAFFIIPGVIFALMFSQSFYLIIEKNLGPIEALKTSHQLTNGQKWPLLGWSFIEILLVIAAGFLLFIGLFILMPILYLANAYIYIKLRDATNNLTPITTSTTPINPTIPPPTVNSVIPTN